MRLLDIFPLPRRYERVPGTLAFTLTAAMAILYFVERTALAAGLLAGSAVLLLLAYLLRFRQRKEWGWFFEEENRRLLEVQGSDGPAKYIPNQREVLASLRNPELRLTARLNLSTALLADADPAGALEELALLNPEKMPNPTLRLLYWTQMLRAFIQLGEAEQAETAYQAAMAVLPEVSDMLKISFMPAEVQYRLLRGEYKLALDQLGEIPDKDLDEAGRDFLSALRIHALKGVGAVEKAEKMKAQLRDHDMLPVTRALLRQAG
ncbi:MAG: hypothetical protein Q4C45_04805 [Oscillospiraceae bacterium]|nr:hypothetical protein [Oscillospiraceae bacterium]